MKKIEKEPRAAAYPAPAALVSAYDEKGKPNAMTAAWISNICADPVTLVVGIRDTRYTYELIVKSGCFGVNIPSVKIAEETDYFGIVSGRDVNKFKKTGLKVFKGKEVNVPLIEQCPINIECKLTKQVKIGTHDAFFGEVLKVYYDESMINESGSPDILLADVLAYGTGNYYSLKEIVGGYGYSKKE
ncbi:MAG: flavin reductase family protein [Candidatus Heimdallarchaeota archaeon]|nr:flavin reductase family protein [Candidatus Heimdallarchaeota archaeon]